MGEVIITQTDKKELEISVSNLLHRLGIPANIKGYSYLRYAIMLSVENEGYVNSITKTLYPKVAKKYSVTASSVERAMRNAISIGWDRGDITILSEFFGFTVNCAKGKPTNSEFIAMLSDNIRLNS